MLGERFGHVLDKPLRSLAEKVRFSPDSITIAGFCLIIASAPVLAFDLRLGAIILLPACMFDLLDGMVARVQGRSTLFGAFLDSLLDRYSDSLILSAIAWRLGSDGNKTGVILVFITLAGSLIISYARARAEALGISATVGLMERTERLIALFVGAISGYMTETLFLLSILTHFTVVQRVLHVRASLKSKDL